MARPKLDRVREVIENFSMNVVNGAISNVPYATGQLADDLRDGAEINIYPNSIRVAFTLGEYGAYVDQGVKAAGGISRAGQGLDPNSTESPFAFSNRKPSYEMAYNLADYLEYTQGISFNNDKHRLGVGYGFAKVIKETGLSRTLFFTDAYLEAFEDLPEDVAEAYGLDVEQFFNFIL